MRRRQRRRPICAFPPPPARLQRPERKHEAAAPPRRRSPSPPEPRPVAYGVRIPGHSVAGEGAEYREIERRHPRWAGAAAGWLAERVEPGYWGAAAEGVC